MKRNFETEEKNKYNNNNYEKNNNYKSLDKTKDSYSKIDFLFNNEKNKNNNEVKFNNIYINDTKKKEKEKEKFKEHKENINNINNKNISGIVDFKLNKKIEKEKEDKDKFKFNDKKNKIEEKNANEGGKNEKITLVKKSKNILKKKEDSIKKRNNKENYKIANRNSDFKIKENRGYFKKYEEEYGSKYMTKKTEIDNEKDIKKTKKGNNLLGESEKKTVLRSNKYSKKNEMKLNYVDEGTDEIKFDPMYLGMKDDELYINVFGDFYNLILMFTNTNLKFNHIMSNYQKIKQNNGKCINLFQAMPNEDSFDDDNDNEFNEFERSIDDETNNYFNDVDDEMNNDKIDFEESETNDESDNENEQSVIVNTRNMDIEMNNNEDEINVLLNTQINNSANSQMNIIFESQQSQHIQINEETNNNSQLKDVKMNELLIGFEPIERDEFMAYIGLLIISGSLNINKLSLKDIFNGIGGLKDFKNTIKFQQYLKIRKNIMFHDIRQDELFKTSIKEIVETTKIKMQEFEEIFSTEYDNSISEQQSNELELNDVNDSVMTNINLENEFEGKSELLLDFMKELKYRIDLLLNKQPQKENIFIEKAKELNELLKEEIDRISNVFIELKKQMNISINNQSNVYETIKSLDDNIILNERIINVYQQLSTLKPPKPLSKIISDFNYLINDYMTNAIKNLKKMILNEYYYSQQYNERKKELFKFIKSENLKFDLYEEENKDGSVLIRDMLKKI